MSVSSWVKNFIADILPNAKWDFTKFTIKACLYLFGGAAMTTSFFAAFFIYFSGVSLNWLIVICLFLVSFTLLFIGFVSGISTTDSKTANTKTEPETDKSENETKTIDAFTAEHLKEIENLKSEFQQKLEYIKLNHESDIRQRDTLLNEVDFLLGIVREQKENIDDYVKLDKFFWKPINNDEPIPHIIFEFHLQNNSVFDVMLNDEIEGYVKFRGQILQGDKRFYGELEKIELGGHDWFRFKYRLSREELDFISHNGEILGSDFDISNLVLMIKGSPKFPQVASKPVKISSLSKVWNYKEYEKAIEPYTHI